MAAVAVGKCDILGELKLLERSSDGVKPDLSTPMTTANCPGNEELDFRLIFGEDGQQQQPLGPAGRSFHNSPTSFTEVAALF